ncbi:hypothetical protein EJ08DRAFT_494215 [Tothia fuscella]|uniref:Uncharacterized protein n=1 Tax=Tothia fuscella TaxID=1048955 RepID=A0A9P4NYS0_9PEZI|nr:hypothetical protein EJ08DRAFT_494215 [Tothia fuscella]
MRRVTQPRTLRITETPKTEIPPALPTPAPVTPAAVSTPVLPPAAVSTIRKQASRRASVTSTAQPGTPISDRMDIMSTTSASASRASSPPPITTNKRSKKDRKAKAAKDAEIAAAISAPKDEPAEEAAPILTRKTKAKKAIKQSVPVPGPKFQPPKMQEEKFESHADAVDRPAEKPNQELGDSDVELPPPQPRAKTAKLSGKGKAKAKAASPSPVPVPESHPASPAPITPTTTDIVKASGSGGRVQTPTQAQQEKDIKTITAQTILHALDCTHQLALSTLNLLKPLTQQSELKRLGIDPFTSADLQNHIEQLRFELSAADDALLKQGKAVRRDLNRDGSGRISGRTMVNPSDKTRLTCLTVEEENKFLELDSRTKGAKGVGKWGGGRGLDELARLGGSGSIGQSEAVKMLNIATETLDGALRDVQAAQREAQRQANEARRVVDEAANSGNNGGFGNEAGDYVNQFVPPSVDSSGLPPQQPPPPSMMIPQSQQHPAQSILGLSHQHPAHSQPGPSQSRFEPDSTFTADSLQEAMATAGAIASGRGVPLTRSGALGNDKVREGERLLQEARKETEAWEKKFNGLVKKNRKVVLGAVGGGA